MLKFLVGSFSLLASIAAGSSTAAAVPVSYNWTGFYVGGHVGWGWGNEDWQFGPSDNNNFSSHNTDGFLGGGQIGHNWQSGPWIYGFEGSISWSNIEGRSECFPGNDNCNGQINWFGTGTGRVGYSYNTDWYAYVKGGFAYNDAKFQVTDVDSGLVYSTAKNNRWGWTIGVGAEWALSPNWSAKLEYNYLDFGTSHEHFIPGAGVERFVDIDQKLHTVMLGINYRFNPPAPPPP